MTETEFEVFRRLAAGDDSVYGLAVELQALLPPEERDDRVDDLMDLLAYPDWAKQEELERCRARMLAPALARWHKPGGFDLEAFRWHFSKFPGPPTEFDWLSARHAEWVLGNERRAASFVGPPAPARKRESLIVAPPPSTMGESEARSRLKDLRAQLVAKRWQP